MTRTLEKIFSVKNDDRKTHKVINVAGLKLKVKKSLIKDIKDEMTYFADKNNPLYKDRIQDGFVRLLLTHKCNAKCNFCPHWKWSEDRLKQELSHEFLFEQCKPLYERIKMLSLTGGEITVYKYGLEFVEFINKNYPKLTIVTETNGINWNEKWQHFASEGLWTTNCSLNASNPKVFKRSCWLESGADEAFAKIDKNINDYVNLLREKGLEVFSPRLSTVVNKESAADVVDFARRALKLHTRSITYFFDGQEQFCTEYFKYPEILRPALKTMMEIERVLAKKVCVYFRLWCPTKEAEPLQEEVEAIPIEVLRKKYSDLLELAKDRDMLKEHQERNRIRKSRGKKEFTFDEDYNATIRLINVGGKQVCFAPWQQIDIMADQTFSFCGWARRRKDLKYKCDKKGNIDWIATINSKPYVMYRKKHYNKDYDGCQRACPMNEAVKPIVPYHKYGFDRKAE